MEKTSSQLSIALFLVACWTEISSHNIELLQCPPPDYPVWGGYGPRVEIYTPGDMIHYYCDVDTYIGGNYLRICLDSGDWSGDTPVCDPPARFTEVEQSSTDEPLDENGADRASDNNRYSCSSTLRGADESWTGKFAEPSQVLRVMLFLPKGLANYEVLSIRADGKEFSCGKGNRRIERQEWIFHNCLEPNNTNIVAIKIKSTSPAPLQLCEVVSHVLTDPTCVDPHVQIENGRLAITRKRANLVCDRGYKRSSSTRLDCIRTGVWTRKNLYCIDTDREVEHVPTVERQPAVEPERETE